MPAIEPREFIAPYDPLGDALGKPIRTPKTKLLRGAPDHALTMFRHTNRIPTPRTNSLAISISSPAGDLAGDEFMPGMGDADFLPGMGDADASFMPGMGAIDDNGMLPGMGDLGHGHGGHHGGHGGGRGVMWGPAWAGPDTAYLETNYIQADESIPYRGYIITCKQHACKVNRVGDSTVLTVVANANEAKAFIDKLAGGVHGLGNMSASFMPGMGDMSPDELRNAMAWMPGFGDAEFLPGMGDDPTVPTAKRTPRKRTASTGVRNITPPVGINQTPAIATKSPRWKNISLRKPLGRPLLGRANKRLPTSGGSMLPGLSHDDVDENSPEFVGSGCVGDDNLYDEVDGFGAFPALPSAGVLAGIALLGWFLLRKRR